MPLGAQHVQATGGADPIGLPLGILPRQGDRLVPRGLVLLGRVHRVQARLAQPAVGDDVRVAAEHDVGATTGHVGRDGDRADLPRLGNDLRLLLVELRVQHVVRDLAPLQLARQVLRALHARCTDQHRLTLLVPLGDVVDDRVELRLFGLVDQVGLILADHRLIGRDRQDAQLVDLVELGGLGVGGTRHSGQLVVHAEVVLQGDRGQRLVFGLDFDALFRLDRLVQALIEAPAVEDASGELVDDDDLAVADDVVLVPVKEFLDLDGVVQVPDQLRIRRVVEILDAQLVFDEGDPDFVHADGLLLDIDLVVHVLLHQRGQSGELDVPLARRVCGAGDDQRGAGLVDEDRVDLVDDAEGVAALYLLVEGVGHVVAQVVEAELIVGAVGDIGVVGALARLRRHRRQDHVGLQAEESVHATHPLRVALGEVVVHRHHVHPLAGERVQVGRQYTGQGFALTGLHLGDIAEVQRRATHDLDVEVLLVQDAPGRFTGYCKRLGQQLVKCLAIGEPLLEFVGLGPQFIVGERGGLVFKRFDVTGDHVESLDHPAFADAEQLVQHWQSLVLTVSVSPDLSAPSRSAQIGPFDMVRNTGTRCASASTRRRSGQA